MKSKIFEEKLKILEILTYSKDIFAKHVKSIILMIVTMILPISIIFVIINYFARSLFGSVLKVSQIDENIIKAQIENLLLKFQWDMLWATITEYIDFDAFVRMALLIFCEFLVIYMVMVVMSVAISKLVEKEVYSEGSTEVDWKLILKQSIASWYIPVGTLLLYRIIQFTATLFLFVPGVVVSVLFAFLIPVVAVKGLGGISAFSYCIRVVKGDWARFTGYVLVMFVLEIVASFFVAATSPVLAFLSEILKNIISTFFLIAMTVFFINVDSLMNKKSLVPSEKVDGRTEDDYS